MAAGACGISFPGHRHIIAWPGWQLVTRRRMGCSRQECRAAFAEARGLAGASCMHGASWCQCPSRHIDRVSSGPLTGCYVRWRIKQELSCPRRTQAYC